MNRKLIAAGAVGLCMMTGCSKPAARSAEAGRERTIHITAKDPNGTTVLDKDVTTTADTLSEVLKNSPELDAKLEDGQYGTMILGLAGLDTEDWNKGPWWTYDSDSNAVCREKSYCPAADEITLGDGDRFEFTFSSGS